MLLKAYISYSSSCLEVKFKNMLMLNWKSGSLDLEIINWDEALTLQPFMPYFTISITMNALHTNQITLLKSEKKQSRFLRRTAAMIGEMMKRNLDFQMFGLED